MFTLTLYKFWEWMWRHNAYLQCTQVLPTSFYWKQRTRFKPSWHEIRSYVTSILTYWSASYITALTARFERYLHIIRSLAAMSASSTIKPKYILLISFWMISRHEIFGRPCLCFLWLLEVQFLGIRSMYIRCRWPISSRLKHTHTIFYCFGVGCFLQNH